MKIIFASNNLHKINEIKSVIEDRYTLAGLEEAGISGDIPEDEDTLEGNALMKARFVYNKTGSDVFADDTGLEVEALNNRPGVYSARYAGDQKNSEDNIDKLLDELGTEINRKAHFRTIIALILDGKEYLFEGMVTGKITFERRGGRGFGYDPVFMPDGDNRTFAEMDIDAKNKLSHRAKAMKKLTEFLNSYMIQ